MARKRDRIEVFNSLTSLEQLMRSMTLEEYIDIFGTIWDPDLRSYSRFIPWAGQRKMLNWLEWLDPKDGLMAHREEAWVPKARQLGISEIAAERGVKTSLAFARSQGIIISKSERDAIYMLKNRVIPKIKNLRPWPGVTYPEIVRENNDIVELSNGSTIQSLPPTQASGASMTLDWILFDEMGGTESVNNVDVSSMYKNAMPATEKSRMAGVGWVMAVGTSEPGTFFNNELKAQTEGRKTPKYFFLSWKTDPNRDAAWVRAEKERLSCEADFHNQYPENMNEFFATREGMVFPSFDPELGGRHIVEKHPSWVEDHEYMVGYDHGFNHWAACLHAVYNPKLDHLHIMFEQYWKATDVHVVADEINQHIASYRRVPAIMLADSQIFNKDSRKSVADHFKDAGVVFKPAYKADEAGSRGMLSERFTYKKITIYMGCRNVIRQISDYRWNPKTKGEKPFDKEDEAPDVMRWFCAHIRKAGPERRPEKEESFSYGRGKHKSAPRIAYTAKGLPTKPKKGGGWQAR